MTELTLIDIGELLVVGILASALNWAVTEYVKRRIWLLSKTARRLAPTVVGLLLTLPGLPLALVWLTPLTWEAVAHPVAIGVLVLVGILGGIANSGGAQWCHSIVRTAIERIGNRADDLMTGG